MNIKNILKVYKRDWKSIIKNPVAIIIIAGICVLPSLYAWVNIKACWNTYENTGDIPVAVVNNDKGSDFNSKKLNVGNEIVKNLKSNHKIGWKFVSSKEASLGLIDGIYYASIEIPKDFSSSFISRLSNNPKKPQIIYKVDTKVNPVANKITDTAKNTLVNEVSSNFIATVNETIFSSLNGVGKDAEDNKDSIIKLKDAIININSNMDTITGSLEVINSTSGSLSSFLSEINSAMPKVQSSIDVIGKSNSDNKAIIESTKSELNNSINNVGISLNSAQASNSKIQGLFKNLNTYVQSGNSSMINSIIPEINTELDSLNTSIDVTIDYLNECNSIDFNTDISKTTDSLKGLQSSLNNIKKQLSDIQSKLNDSSQTIDDVFSFLNGEVPKIDSQIDSATASISSVISTLNGYNETLNSPLITGLINLLQSEQTHLGSFKLKIDEIAAKSDTEKQTVKDIAASLSGDISNIITEIGTINGKIDSVINFLQSVSTSNTEKKQEVSSIISSLKSIQTYVSDEKRQFGTIQGQANSANGISKGIADSINSDISNINTQITNSINSYNSGVKSVLNSIADNLAAATQDASDLIDTAKNLSIQINKMMGTALQGTNLAYKFSGDLNDKLSEFKDVIKQLSGKLQLVSNNDIVQIISILESNPKLIGDYMSNPFDVKNESIYQIPNYGTGMAPIYTTLALWVGCLILNSLFKTDVGYFEGVEKLTLREKHFGKMMIFSTLAMIQGFIISFGDKYLLHVYTVSTPLLIIVSIVSSLVFSIITYTLVSTLGNVGKALSIIYMILQIAGSGGSYPIQVDPKIFRILQPLFPFTYTIGGLREAIAGPLVSSVALDFVALSLFAVVFLLCGFFFKEPLYKRVHKFEVEFKKSGVGE